MDTLVHGHDLGNRMIDRDHQEISELLLEINFNASRNEDAGQRIQRLRSLTRLARSHFLLEETMMAATKYPGLALHCRRHAWMMQQIKRLEEYWNKEQNALTREPIGLLWESHIAHLDGEDRAYGLWLDGAAPLREPDHIHHLMTR